MEYADLLLKLVLAHFLGDFVLQPDSWVADRKKRKLKSPWLYVHSLVHAALSYLFLADWGNIWLPLLIMSGHFLADLWKSGRPDSTRLFLTDQLFHLAFLSTLWMLFYGQAGSAFNGLLQLWGNEKVLVCLAAALILIWPSAILIRKLTAFYQEQIPVGEGDRVTDGLKDAGKWIGIIERLLILVFILLHQYQVIGFLIAAKSVFRYGEIKNSQDRMRVEYLFIGTLVSFSLAIFAGLICLQIIKQI